MTWEDATDAILQHFKTQWEVLHPATPPVHYPNAKPVTGTSWLRFRFIPAFARRIAVGGGLRETGGQVVVNVFTPAGTGDGVAASYGAEIEGIWEAAKANGLSGAIHLGAPEPLPEGPDPDSPSWRSGVAISFRFDHTP